MNPSNSSRDLIKSFQTGVAVWLLAMIILFGLAYPFASPETASGALMWAFGYWWIGFLAGLGAVVLSATASKNKSGGALVAFLLPVLIVGGIAILCYTIYPTAGFASDLKGYLPMVLVFYVVGLIWMKLRSSSNQAMPRAIVPPLVGGLLLLAFVATPVFSSNAFKFRDAFDLKFEKMTQSGEELGIDAILEVRKPGNYTFQALHYHFLDFAMEHDEDAGRGVIEWQGGQPPAPEATGSFPLRITWTQTTPPGYEMGIDYSMYAPMLEVRDADAPKEILTTISAPLPGQPE